MKWRHTVVYVIVLALVAGYYYYFEVVKRKEAEEAERASKKVFAVSKEAVQELVIGQKGKEPVELVRTDGAWKIRKPLETEADGAAVESVVSTLVELEKERSVGKVPEDLKPFGLDKPELTLRFRAGEQWHELRLGSPNPAQDSRYATRDQGGDLFLVASGTWGVLNKGLNELRRRELFTFENDQVTRLIVAWDQGAKVELKRLQDGDTWQAPQDPQKKIKASKVENVLDQIRWLRAKDFVDTPGTHRGSGLDHPAVTVTLHLKGGDQRTLQAQEPAAGASVLRALSSELPFVVEVDKDFLEELPRSLHDVEDRSVFTADSDAIAQVEWVLGESKGRVVRLKEGEWGRARQGAEPEQLKESWRVRSLFWEWEDLEYEGKDPKRQKPKDKDLARLVFRDQDGGTLAAFSWKRLPEKDKPETVVVWTDQGEALLVKAEKMEQVEKKLKDLIHAS
ncbi:protein of unknown function [Desulfacinum hydrothermale DSM 13146]|uniref:DUF4340 domain-containing protein n=1 Tax=Desulfacinum hydrothermale DSM 13146 TaxID=1121390 RepID=A0A1W1XHD7_9BACT|nr:DUF4340 domain-containing protein [Desulfacinum hydrothermale]SMC23370.1 protein of unknown function [Desulfacinum hydrothermale DSM 13146]